MGSTYYPTCHTHIDKMVTWDRPRVLSDSKSYATKITYLYWNWSLTTENSDIYFPQLAVDVTQSMLNIGDPTKMSWRLHHSDVMMGTMASQITSLTIVYSTVYSGTDQRKHQGSASLAFVRGTQRRPVNFPHKGPVTLKMFPFDDVIMKSPAIILFDESLWRIGPIKQISKIHIYGRSWGNLLVSRGFLTAGSIKRKAFLYHDVIIKSYAFRYIGERSITWRLNAVSLYARFSPYDARLTFLH